MCRIQTAAELFLVKSEGSEFSEKTCNKREKNKTQLNRIQASRAMRTRATDEGAQKRGARARALQGGVRPFRKKEPEVAALLGNARGHGEDSGIG